MAGSPLVTQVATGVYQVEYEGRSHIVHVAGADGGTWAFAEGRVYREGPASAGHGKSGGAKSAVARPSGPQVLTAPMPATVLQVLVRPGASVKKGDTVILLEAMKMELPLRAPGDATVIAVHCREGELVQPDVTLIELA